MDKPYQILGINENASEQEAAVAYQTLKEKYSEERFLSGEKGNFAAAKLAEIEEAYSEVKTAFAKDKAAGEDGSKYFVIDSLLKAGDAHEAQYLLDGISERDGEWHYFQSIVFFKKNHYGESKTQLEYAIAKEPASQKYQTAYDKLTKLMANPEPKPPYNSVNNPQMGGEGLCGNDGFCC